MGTFQREALAPENALYRCMCGGTRFLKEGEVLRVACDRRECFVYLSPFDNPDPENLDVLISGRHGMVMGTIRGLPEIGMCLNLHSEYEDIVKEFSGVFEIVAIRETSNPACGEISLFCLGVARKGSLDRSKIVTLLHPCR